MFKEYDIGDLTIVLDDTAKSLTEELTGKPYETGDLSKELDKRVKNAVASYCGKGEGEYQFGDLSKEVDRRVKARVSDFLGKEYEFGDITREVNSQRKAWIKDILGEEAAEQYQVRFKVHTRALKQTNFVCLCFGPRSHLSFSKRGKVWRHNKEGHQQFHREGQL